jgi:hypothetical protein
MGEAHEGVHQGELPWVVELEAWDALACRGDGWLGEAAKLAAVDEGLQDVLLDIEVIVVDGTEPIAESRKVLDGFVDPVVCDVIGCRLCPQDQMIADILLDEAMSVMASDHGVGQVHIGDLGLQLAAIEAGDPSTEDRRDFVRWPMVRLASRRRSPSLSKAARRSKIKLSQNSTWAKNKRC